MDRGNIPNKSENASLQSTHKAKNVETAIRLTLGYVDLAEYWGKNYQFGAEYWGLS